MADRVSACTDLAFLSIYSLIKGRGAPRGGRGAPFRGGRGGGSGPPASTEERKKREAILDLSKYVNERIRVKFTGGREGINF